MTTREIYNAQAEALEQMAEECLTSTVLPQSIPTRLFDKAESLRALAAQAPEGEPVATNCPYCGCEAKPSEHPILGNVEPLGQPFEKVLFENLDSLHETDHAPVPASTHYSHTWDDAGERCTVCGDKDWMGGGCAPPAPAYPDFEGIPPSAAQQAERIATLTAELERVKAERDKFKKEADEITEAMDDALHANRQESAAMAALLEKAERTLSERNTELTNTQDQLEAERDVVKRIWEASGAENGKSIVEQIAALRVDAEDNYWQGMRRALSAEGYAEPHIERIVRSLKAIDAARGRE